MNPIIPIMWRGGKVKFLDQTALPESERYVETDDEAVLAAAVKRLSIRGAPLIGIAAAYGIALSMLRCRELEAPRIAAHFDRTDTLFASTRPTAVNLFWSLERLRNVFDRVRGETLEFIQQTLLAEAELIHREDAEMCERIGEYGAELLPNAVSVLTHCNAGRLATGGRGTALGVIEKAWERRTLRHVYIGETRPLLQGARLTAWELEKAGIPATLITDSTAAFLMQQGKVNAVVVGADRIAANGDVANKVGTYGLAVLAHHHSLPFYVAAPTSTIDLEMASGKLIPIEQRDASEVTTFAGKPVAPPDVEVYAPAFDITPHGLMTAIITDLGVLRPPFVNAIDLIRTRVSGDYSDARNMEADS
jgi:methylthioribose-1-phosphate isomerase